MLPLAGTLPVGVFRVVPPTGAKNRQHCLSGAAGRVVIRLVASLPIPVISVFCFWISVGEYCSDNVCGLLLRPLFRLRNYSVVGDQAAYQGILHVVISGRFGESRRNKPEHHLRIRQVFVSHPNILPLW